LFSPVSLNYVSTDGLGEVILSDCPIGQVVIGLRKRRYTYHPHEQMALHPKLDQSTCRFTRDRQNVARASGIIWTAAVPALSYVSELPLGVGIPTSSLSQIFPRYR
jgi:hypothetical protein